MRLLNIETLKLEEFVADPPPYAILSHAWEAGEVTLQDLDRPDVLALKPGWTKIVNFCAFVNRCRKGNRHAELADESMSPVRYIWVDTCCIDKTSTADLSESINSMFQWYRDAAVCFAYLSDVQCPEGQPSVTFEQSRWFTRGWTLQELLAPKSLEFLDGSWRHFGSRASLVDRVSQRTRIPLQVLVLGEWSRSCIAQRMSWAAGRQTTRPEDIAYCLLGIFGVNMPLLYGEGGERAFFRLQEEILKEFDDQSIFAWDASGIDETWGTIGALAPSPAYFADSLDVEAIPFMGRPMSSTKSGGSVVYLWR
ncbi:HET-domain-containing protein [Sodiomyces alkalinus F11]|uniref:HET-domain-containing protein n=1 Tax=Sodiomyces alkalinus (strain CBS 110278 / VKM F-3762 / F11) TaxID=1314773 RepID=A0A3N2Q4A4_SODAK|nr:HET-domain-containing protein [Sodiomyces alkalinus F11]ROT41589.1 HET-domain-containing protein [Sodiomyces alkalinus F11]